MISSRANPRVLGVAALTFAMACVLPPVASAQAPQTLPPADSPVQLGDPAVSAPQPLQAPRRLLPQSGAPAQPETAPVAPSAAVAPVKSGIQIDGLTGIDPESVGVLTPADGGLGETLWTGMTRADAVALVDAVPGDLASRALRDFAVRIMLSRASAPAAASADAPSLLAARAKTLMRFGRIDEVRRLLAAASTQNRPADLDAIDAALGLIAYDNARACGLAQNNQERAAEDFWQRLLIYCDAVNGRAAGVTLGLSLLRESAGDDPALVILTDAVLSGEKVLLDTLEDPNLVHLALSRAAGISLPDVLEADAPPTVIAAAVSTPTLSLGARIDAAERALAAGTATAQALQQLYMNLTFAPEDIADALTRADEAGGAGGRALLYQAAAANNIPVARAEIITQALTLAREDGAYDAAVRAFKPLMDRLPPSPEMAWFALTGFRAYVAMADPVGAEKWLALLRASAVVREEVQLALDRVRPLAWLLGVRDTGADVNDVLRAWQAATAEQPELAAAAELLNGLVAALGHDLDPDVWPSDGAISTQTFPPSALWFRFQESLANAQPVAPAPSPARLAASRALPGLAAPAPTPAIDRNGPAEPALLLLQAVGSVPAERIGVILAYDFVSALRELGFETTARRLAVEWALAAGI